MTATSRIAEIIGENIAAARRRRGWSQELLAERIEIAQGSLSRLEAGTREASVERLVQIAGALGCSLLDLLKGVEAPEGESYRKGYADGWRDCADDARAYLARPVKAVAS